MSLRAQLLMVSLLLLSLPWAGCQYLREMEATLREGQGAAAAATARALAAALREQPSRLYSVAARRGRGSLYPDWYVPAAERVLVSDGYSDDWREQPRLTALPDTPAGIRLFAASYRRLLYLLFEIEDQSLRYSTPLRAGDRIRLHCVDALGANSRYELSAEAPGAVRVRGTGGGFDRFAQAIRGAWRERAGGYAVELQLPLDTRCQRLSVSVIDVPAAPGGSAERERYDSRDTFAGETPWLVYQIPELNTWLNAFSEPGRRIAVRDAAGWVVGELRSPLGDELPESAASDEVFWLLRWLYRSVLADRGAAATRSDLNPDYGMRGWRTLPGDESTTLLQARAGIGDGQIDIGSVELTETTERYLALTDRASSRLFGVSALVLLAAFAGLLAYASLLSWRVRRLRDAAAGVAEGMLETGDFPRSRAADELGQLSRGYADLLAQLGEYNSYLRSLARSLSHELRTPIAVVGSSLDNLRRETGNDQSAAAYVARAEEGLARLARIVSAMSEASRIEESVQGTALEALDLDRLLAALVEAYRDGFVGQSFSLSADDGPHIAQANGELIAQALDKLVDNAVSFARPGTAVDLRLRRVGGEIAIDVSNTGPTLPDTLRERLFEPMVSVRDDGDRAHTHLGLGLHIARSIAEGHGGRLLAENLADGSGVRFTLQLPAVDGQAAPGR